MASGRLDRRRGARSAALAAALIVASACGSPTPTTRVDPSASPVPSDAATSAVPAASPGALASAGVSPVPAASPGTDAPPEASLLLTEVRYAPAGADAAFIELGNVGERAIDPSAYLLRWGDRLLPLRSAAAPIDPGERLLVLLDGLGAEANTPGVLHGNTGHVLDEVVEAVELLDSTGLIVDRVAWGDDAYAVRAARGGIAPETVEPGSTVGRVPGSGVPNERIDWVTYMPAEASPGEPNPVPAVVGLHPIDGAVIDGPGASLSWYPATGAERYRVQVAADDSFAVLLLDETVDEPEVETSLPAGSYVWRVAAIGSNGSTAPSSERSGFEVGVATAAIPPWIVGGPDGASTAAAAPRTSARPVPQLAVPMIHQHKDTPMLLMERNVRTGSRHAWDLDHGVLDKNDKADNANCVLASIAMLNRYANGDLSQDRIGFEVFKDREDGPERDLDYDDGFLEPMTRKALEFAFASASPGRSHPGSYEDLWSLIATSVDRGVPLLAEANHHAFVITGYSGQGRDRLILTNDPWDGPGTVRLADVGRDVTAAGPGWDVWELGRAARARTQEPTIHQDSDGDGVVDFDEIVRFGTDPNLADTDLDGVLDKEDIAASVFDRTYGYAVRYRSGSPLPTSYRDFDSDGDPTELDPDSDDGGCEDGREDADAGGDRDPGETWNFLASDDSCGATGGTIAFTSRYATPDGLREIVDSLHINVRLKRSPDDPRAYVDDGSSFGYHGTSHSEIDVEPPWCPVYSDAVMSAGGPVVTADPDASGIAGTIIIGGDSPTPSGQPRRDELFIGFSARTRAQGTADYCPLGLESSEWFGSVVLPDCPGTTTDPPTAATRTFTFQCHQTGDWTWTVSGSVTVR